MNVMCATANLGQDPELKQTRGGTSVLELSLAITTRMKRGDEYVNETSWLRASLFGKRAESLASILRKGDRVGVTGALYLRQYERNDGSKGLSAELVNCEVTLLGERREGGRTPMREHASASAPAHFAGGWDFNDDFGDIPFARCDVDTRVPHDPCKGVVR